MKPSIGRIVHFVPPSANVGPESIKVCAAIITQVNTWDELTALPETVELATLGPNSLYFQHSIPYSEEPKPGHWNWPPKTP